MRGAGLLLALAVLAGAGYAAWTALGDTAAPEPAPDELAATPAEIAAEQGSRRTSLARTEPEADPAQAERMAEIERRRRAVAFNDQALVALDGGDLDRAIELFESCLALDPEELVFRRNLAEALARLAAREYERADPEAILRAIELLERAVELAPERTALAERLARWRKVAETEDGFWIETSEHFELAYDGSRDELLWKSGDLLEILEQAYLEFGELFGRYPVEHGRSRIRVVLYRKSEFDGVTGLGHWAGGVFDGTVRVPVEDLGREKHVLSAVLRHEVLHAFVRHVGGARVPAWLDEGLAQRLESADERVNAARLAAARKRLAGGELFPLERLRQGIARWTDPDQIRRAYDQSLCFLAWIEHQYGERVPYEMVLRLADGVPVDETFRTRTGASLDLALETLAQDL